MSSENAVIRVSDVGKCYHLYDRPADRLRQFILPRAERMLGRDPARHYREFWALHDVSFEVQRGDQLGVVGRNGAGKSTLLQILCGTLQPTTGRVEVSGRIAALLELGAGFNPVLTGAENVFLNGSVLGLSRAQIEQRYDRILAFADIGEFIHQPVRSYSSGMYMRLAFAIAVHVDPDILVVDEALAVGDEAFQRKCHARIERLREQGATILFVSHSASHVIEVCNRAILLDRGELLASGAAKHVVSRYQKLIYAPAARLDDLRAAMRLERAGLPSPLLQAPRATPGPQAAAADVPGEGDEADFDHGLVPQSTVAYPQLGCEILDPHICNADGRRVNILRGGGRYLYRYRVRFDAPTAGVRFTMLLKTVSGIGLGGAVSAPGSQPHEFYEAGEEVEVEFHFTAALATGTYFLNAGVRGLVGEEETFLHRVVDVAMFRVERAGNPLATGLVDFGVSASVTGAGNGSAPAA